MPQSSKMELSGSPFEQTSKATITYTWDLSSGGTSDLATGETLSSPGCQVLEFDPTMGGNLENAADGKDVTSTAVVSGDPRVSDTKILIGLAGLTAGKIYRVLLWATGSVTHHVPSRFFYISCKV